MRNRLRLLLIFAFLSAACNHDVARTVEETGSAASPLPSVDVSGIWVGTFDILGSSRPFTFQLHQRDDGRVMGYIAGGTSRRAILDGYVDDDQLSLDIEFANSQATAQFALSGTVDGDTLEADVTEALPAIDDQTVTLTRISDTYEERQFAFANPNDFSESVELAVVLDSNGDFVSGGFVGYENCDLWACSGGVSSFSVGSGGAITIGLETAGGCSSGSSLSATFDSGSKMYSGSYSFTNCYGTSTGSIVGMRAMGTTSAHVADVLAMYAGLADDIEDRISFASHPAFASTFLDQGREVDDVLCEFDTEVATYESITVDFGGFANIATVLPSDANPYAVRPFSAQFRDMRAGTRVAEGGSPVTYVDTIHYQQDSRPDRLAYLVESSGDWLLEGNQEGCGSECSQITGPTVGNAGNDADRVARSLAVDPGDADVVYVGSEGNGMFKSSDGGTTWTRLRQGLRNSNGAYAETFQIVIDPNDTDVLYAATNQGPTPGYGGGVGAGGIYRSDDGGSTWHQKYCGMANVNTTAVAVNPLDSSKLIVAVGGGVSTNNANSTYLSGGFYSSSDSGGSWSRGTTPTGGYQNRYFQIVLRTSGSTVVPYSFGFTDDDAYPARGIGFIQGNSSGSSWSLLGDPMNGENLVHFAVSTDGATLYMNGVGGDMWKSTDGGDNWSSLSPGSYGPILIVNPSASASSQIVLAADGDDLYRSTNGGANWSQVTLDDGGDTCTTNCRIEDLEVAPSSSSRIYLGREGLRIYRSDDSGASFALVKNLRTFITSNP